MRDTPKPFEIYRHFKGNMYQILTMAQDAGDGRRLVVYQALYGDYRVYVRDLEEFLSKTDRDKYPGAVQRYRFERVDDPGEAEAKVTDAPKAAPEKAAAKDASPVNVPQPKVEKPADRPVEKETAGGDMPDLDPAVLEFLEAETYEQRLNILISVKHRITDDMLNTMAVAADVEVEPGPVEERFSSLKNALLTKERFESVRLR